MEDPNSIKLSNDELALIAQSEKIKLLSEELEKRKLENDRLSTDCQMVAAFCDDNMSIITTQQVMMYHFEKMAAKREDILTKMLRNQVGKHILADTPEGRIKIDEYIKTIEGIDFRKYVRSLVHEDFEDTADETIEPMLKEGGFPKPLYKFENGKILKIKTEEVRGRDEEQ